MFDRQSGGRDVSDNYLRLIPTDPHYMPPDEAGRRASLVVSHALPAADRVQVKRHSQPVFIDQGTNLESVLCPRCRARVAFYGDTATATSEWWKQIADQLGGQQVADVRVTMSCCGSSVMFQELQFEWPAGVASFEISIRNPGIGEPLGPELVAQLEGILGCGIRQVWAHY